MQSKSLLIAIAAFAVTATGVHSYGGANILGRAGLSEKQVGAIQEAQQLRMAGDVDAARNILAEAGITEDELLSIHHAAREAQAEMRAALQAGDYEAFKLAVADGPLADIITTEDDFEQFREAHRLRHEGEFKESQLLLQELGLDVDKRQAYQRGFRRHFTEQLSVEQQDAFAVARQANDRATMHAIMDEAGLDFHSRRQSEE